MYGQATHGLLHLVIPFKILLGLKGAKGGTFEHIVEDHESLTSSVSSGWLEWKAAEGHKIPQTLVS